jgi:GNAT superfamily N-acetyltransferase
VAPLAESEFDELLPLISDYQRFYGVGQPDDERNRRFFARFLGDSPAGSFLGARRHDDLVGYACLYYAASSVEAQEIIIMNDLFVVDGQRGAGVGRSLIEATVAVAERRGVGIVRWSTALDNRRAQRLYEQMGAERSSWFEYEIVVGPAER